MAQLTVAITKNMSPRRSLARAAIADCRGSALLERARYLRGGHDKCVESAARIVDFVNETGQALGARAEEFSAWVLQKIRELTTRTFDYLLDGLRS